MQTKKDVDMIIKLENVTGYVPLERRRNISRVLTFMSFHLKICNLCSLVSLSAPTLWPLLAAGLCGSLIATVLLRKEW